ncbi:sulfhydryl oxidase 1-like isoform X2 [Rhopilema esculentum]|uniref:sulfhydryl oxidase 1-like isoform X2 n=1 Tax=Rhopilema esculentum TaxID=499914 RepID=UPI0031DB0410
MAADTTIFLVTFFLGCFCFHGIDASLYSKDDPMEIFDNSTIKSHIYNSNYVWIVEFYSSWCGHCHAFAPTWKRFSRQIQSWDHVVRAGVIDCAEDKNLDTCRSYEIQSFPTVKLFGANLKNKSDVGINFKGQKTVRKIRHWLVEFVEKQDTFNDVLDFSPADLHVIESFTSKRSETKKPNAKLLVLIFEEKDSFIGRELILETTNCKKLKVKRVLETQTDLAEKFNVEEYPSMIIVDQKGSFKEVSGENKTRKGYLAALNRIEPLSQDLSQTIKKPKKTKGLAANSGGDNYTTDVFMTDLVSSISFSLRREVPKIRVIKGEALNALKNWVNLLMQCTPAEAFLSRYLAGLDKWLKRPAHQSSVTSGEWLQYMDEQQKFDSYLPVEVEWRGCQGSKPHYRGFPCSLWVLFHTMTVHCGTKPKPDLTGLEILRRIRGFIDYFFGCRYCRNHFVAMASNLDNEVKSNDDAILWLWERHNRVNARLASDLSSDPQHPKIQFPWEEICKECRSGARKNNTIVTSPGYGISDMKWNRRMMLEFLKKHYGPDNIRLKDKNPFADGENEESDTEFVRFACPELPEGEHPGREDSSSNNNDVIDRSHEANPGLSAVGEKDVSG